MAADDRFDLPMIGFLFHGSRVTNVSLSIFACAINRRSKGSYVLVSSSQTVAEQMRLAAFALEQAAYSRRQLLRFADVREKRVAVEQQAHRFLLRLAWAA